jgi:hypothetical protein
MTENHDQAVVVAGIGCRPPSDATSQESFWSLFVNVLAGYYGIIDARKNHQNPTSSKKVVTMNGETVFRDTRCLAKLMNLDGESA